MLPRHSNVPTVLRTPDPRRSSHSRSSGAEGHWFKTFYDLFQYGSKLEFRGAGQNICECDTLSRSVAVLDGKKSLSHTGTGSSRSESGGGGGDPLVKMPTLQLGRRQVQKTTYANFVLANEFESSRYSRLCSEDSPCPRQNSLGRELGQSARWFNTNTLYGLIWKGKLWVIYARIQTRMGQQHSLHVSFLEATTIDTIVVFHQ